MRQGVKGSNMILLYDIIQISNAGVQTPAGGPAAKPKELELHVQKTTCGAKNGTKK